MTSQFLPFFRRKFLTTTVKAIRHAKLHPVQSATRGTLAFGTILLGTVFWDIGELPQVDIASVVPLLATVALGGLLITVSLAMFGLAGGVIARFSFSVPSSINERWVLATYLLPGLMVGASLSVYALAYPTWSSYNSSIPGVLTLVGPLMAALVIFPKRRSFAGWTKAVSAWVSLAWNSAALAAIASLLFVNALPATTHPKNSIKIFGVALALWACYFGGLVFFARRIQRPQHIGRFLAGALVAASLVMAATGAWTAVAQAMVKKIGWGNTTAKLFLTDRGCEMFNRTVGEEVCRLKPGAKAQYVCPVLVRSRIGTPVFVSVSPFSTQGGWPNHEKLRHVSLPKEDVIVVQPISATRGLTAYGLPRDGLVTYLDLPAGKKGNWLVEQCGVDREAVVGEKLSSGPSAAP